MCAGAVPERRFEPVARGPGVGHGLLGGERLGGDEDEGPGRIESGGGVGEVRAVHVGDEVHARSVVIRPQGADRHLRAKVRAADADVHDVGERAAAACGGVAPGANAFRKAEKPFLNGVRLAHDPDPVHRHALVRAATQGRVQRRPIFRRVDPLSREHRIAPGGQLRRNGEGEEGIEGRPIDLLLGEVDEQVFKGEGKGGEAVGVPCEQLPERERIEPRALPLHRAPRAAHRIGHPPLPATGRSAPPGFRPEPRRPFQPLHPPMDSGSRRKGVGSTKGSGPSPWSRPHSRCARSAARPRPGTHGRSPARRRWSGE